MVKVFDVNDENVISVEDVVRGMYENTSPDGVLCVTPFEEFDFVKLVGYFECKMNMEIWCDDYESIVLDLENVIQDIIDYDGPAYEANVIIEDDVQNNYFSRHILDRAVRISRLMDMNAPEVIVMREIKAFAFYWILNTFALTL